MEAEERTNMSPANSTLTEANGGNVPNTDDATAYREDSPDHESEDEVEANAVTHGNGNSNPRKRERSPLPDGMTRSAYKRHKRQQKFVAGKKDRKVKEKERIKARKAARREAIASGEVPAPPPQIGKEKSVTVPVTVIIDCGFDDLMLENEIKSLASQITRCYSDNNKARFRVHLAVSSFDKRLKERFDTVLEKQYAGWKGITFHGEDFVAVAEKAKKAGMSGVVEGALATATAKTLDDPNTTQAGGEEQPEGEIVYLSSESPNTLTHLSANSTYIIGGLVDRNRHKGICYKRACDRGIKTAKLPIGDFMVMNDRKVLATNHVNEIMLRWLEEGDWGAAFDKVIPKRKGGKLKSQMEQESVGGGKEEDEQADGDDDVDDVEGQDGEAEGKADDAARGADSSVSKNELG